MTTGNVDILLIEDSLDDAEMTVRALRKINLANNIMHVENGQDALDFLFGNGKFKNHKLTSQPKVILLDIKMPKVDGIEVLRRVKSDKTTRMIPVVIMTSSAEEKDLVTSYRLGANSYVVKPVDFENFARTVSELGLYWLLANRTIQ